MLDWVNEWLRPEYQQAPPQFHRHWCPWQSRCIHSRLHNPVPSCSSQSNTSPPSQKSQSQQSAVRAGQSPKITTSFWRFYFIFYFCLCSPNLITSTRVNCPGNVFPEHSLRVCSSFSSGRKFERITNSIRFETSSRNERILWEMATAHLVFAGIFVGSEHSSFVSPHRLSHWHAWSINDRIEGLRIDWPILTGPKLTSHCSIDCSSGWI